MDFAEQRAALEQQQQQLQPYKQQVSKAEQENIQARQQIEAARGKMQSQQVMRQQTGISGLQQRQRVEGQISQADTALKQREVKVRDYTGQISSAESSIQSGIEELNTIQAAQQLYEQNVNPKFVGGQVGVYLRKLYAQEDLSKDVTEAINAGKIPQSVQDALDRLKSQGITGDQALNAIGFTTTRTGQADRTTNINDVKIDIPNLPAITESAKQREIRAASPQQTSELAYIKSQVGQRNPVNLILERGAQWLVSNVAKSEKGQVYGQKLFSGESGERVKGIVATAPYFIPGISPFVLVAGGIGALTPGGLKESQSFGESIQQKYNIPSSVASIGYTGLQIYGGYLGAKAIAPQIESLAGYPKFATRTFSQEVGQVDDVTRFKTFAKTEQRNLLAPDKTYLSVALTDVAKAQQEANPQRFMARTAGISREYAPILDLTSGYKPINPVGQPIKFISKELGAMQQQQINAPLGRNNLFSAYKTTEGYVGVSAGLSQSQRVGSVVTKQPNVQKFTSVFVGLNPTEETTLIVGKSANYARQGEKLVISKSGQQYSLGIFKRAPAEVSSGDVIINTGFTETRVPSTMIKSEILASPKAIAEIKSKEAIQRAITTEVEKQAATSRFIAKVAGATRGIISPVLKSDNQYKILPKIETKIELTQATGVGTTQKQYNLQVQSQPQQEKIKQTEVVIPKEAQFERLSSLSIQGLSQQQKQKQAQIPNQLQVQTTMKPKQFDFQPNKMKFQGFKNPISSKIYSIFKKRFGKDRYIGKAESIEEASRLLKRSLKSDLGASGFVSEGGNKIKARELGLNQEFSTSKKDIFRLVQQRKFRLSGIGEKKEIQMFKKQAPSKKKRRFKWF